MGEKKGIKARHSSSTLNLNSVFQEVIDSIEDDLLIIDLHHQVKLANSAICAKLPKDLPTPIGKHCYEVFQGLKQPCHAPLWECPMMKVSQTGSEVTLVYPYSTPATGSMAERYCRITMRPLRDDTARINAVVELRSDVTPERELERDILRRHYHLDALSQVSSAVSGLWDLNTILNAILDTVLGIFNGSIGGIMLFEEQEQKWYYKAHRGLSSRFIQEIRLSIGEGIAGKVAHTGEPILVEDISRDPSAARPDLLSIEGLKGFVSVPLKSKEKVVGVMNIASTLPGKFSKDDMYLLNSIGYQLGTAIEQAKLYQYLSDAKERYQKLLRRALTIQEEERKRIARELHDETAQELTALALNLQAINEMFEMTGVENADLKAIMGKTHAIAVQSGSNLTRLIRELRPTLLDTLGLPAALRRLGEANLASKGVTITTEFKGLEQRLPQEMELALFRIIQEAISNVVRHAEAKNVAINLACDDNECFVRVEDDGKGFDVSQITTIDSTGRGAGLFGMKERVTLIGGECHIDSRPGSGTKVMAKVPVMRSTGSAENKSPDS